MILRALFNAALKLVYWLFYKPLSWVRRVNPEAKSKTPKDSQPPDTIYPMW